MSIVIAIKVVVSIFLYVSTVILSFALFKIPIKDNHRTITIMGLTLGVLNYYLKDILLTQTFPVFIIVIFIVLLIVLKSYPFIYAFIVSAVSFFTYATIDFIASFSAIQLKLTNEYLIRYSTLHNVLMEISLIITYTSVAAILVKLNIGFSLMVKLYRSPKKLRINDFIWATIIVAGIIIYNLLSLKIPIYSFNGLILFVILLIFFLVIFYSYRQNKKSLAERKGKK